MNRELIVNVNPTEISIALCEDKVLVELNKEQCQTGFAVGDIYLGKVRKIMPGLNAAFVNIGHEKDAFIHYLDLGSQFSSLQKLVASYQPGKRGIRLDAMKLEPPIEKSGKIGSYLQVGQTVMVQVAKEAISTKGPRLTADISLAGRNVVLVPFSSKVFLSQKIRSAEEKKRLKGIAAAVLPKNFCRGQGQRYRTGYPLPVGQMAEDPAKYSQESRSGSVDERDEPGQHHYPGFVGRRLFADRRGRRSDVP